MTSRMLQDVYMTDNDTKSSCIVRIQMQKIPAKSYDKISFMIYNI